MTQREQIEEKLEMHITADYGYEFKGNQWGGLDYPATGEAQVRFTTNDDQISLFVFEGYNMIWKATFSYETPMEITYTAISRAIETTMESNRRK